ncbi:hypothetical protein [Bordetella flabilis]|uniref:Uncharacterized protein n=1 Tax=Bordetella flabilis TaxID=463014 RepID=A0A193GMW7_9BORD|nr:hypothetical protein [Bordetella flabilis]ANN80831.1 hypothetical protein BAU07_26250 [Bordetella flabilis]
MHPDTAMNDEAEDVREIQKFAQGFRSLLIPSPAVLANTAILLKRLVLLSDKVLPVKSYFNMVQEMQRAAFLAEGMAADAVQAEGLTGERAAERTREIIREVEAKGATFWSIAAKDAKGELKERLQQLDQDSQRALCTEDTFVIVCSYLKGEVAKQGSVHYLRGQSPDFKETKKHRNPLDLSKEVVLKGLSSALARPDAERGSIERGQIDSGFNHLARLNSLAIIMLDVVEWIRVCEKNGTPCRKIDVRAKFDLSHTDYERVMAMARRAGLYTLRSHKKDPSNRYTLKSKIHQRIVDQAAIFGYTPQKTLNKILDDFFRLTDYSARLGRSPEQVFNALVDQSKEDPNA